jgi:hypothetical protein
MNGYSEIEPPDPNLQKLVSRFLDGTCSSEDRALLEERIKNDPGSRDYCAQAIRFEAALDELVNPGHLEWEETRRLTIDPQRGRDLSLKSRFRIGPPRRRWPWLLPSLLLVGIVIVAIWWMVAKDSTSQYQLRNGDFEAMDLSQSPSSVSESILYWQESFSTSNANLVDLNRETGGKLYAKSGHNVVRLGGLAYLNQVILDQDGNSLLAEPGLRCRVKGFYLSEAAGEDGLVCSLRFVASGYPAMVQYEAAVTTLDVKNGGWHAFSAEMELPEDLWLSPTIFSESLAKRLETPPAIDLTDRPLALSIDNYLASGYLFLDDLSIEVFAREDADQDREE